MNTINCCPAITNPLVTPFTKIEAENLMITLNLNANFINYHISSKKKQEKEPTPYPYTHPIRDILERSKKNA
jgi:hypothetical protein